MPQMRLLRASAPQQPRATGTPSAALPACPGTQIQPRLRGIGGGPSKVKAGGGKGSPASTFQAARPLGASGADASCGCCGERGLGGLGRRLPHLLDAGFAPWQPRRLASALRTLLPPGSPRPAPAGPCPRPLQCFVKKPTDPQRPGTWPEPSLGLQGRRCGDWASLSSCTPSLPAELASWCWQHSSFPLVCLGELQAGGSEAEAFSAVPWPRPDHTCAGHRGPRRPPPRRTCEAQATWREAGVWRAGPCPWQPHTLLWTWKMEVKRK